MHHNNTQDPSSYELVPLDDKVPEVFTSDAPITEETTEIKKILVEVNEKSKNEDTIITVEIVHDHKTKRNIVIILIKEFGKNVFARVFSISSYYLSWQWFINLTPINLRLSPHYGNQIQMVNVVRETLRFINQDTKMAANANKRDKLKSLFLMLHLAAIPTTLVTLAINQTYALLLPTFERDQDICDQLRWIPSLFAFNYYLVIVLTAYNYYGNGRGHLNALLGIFCLGGIAIMGSYYGISQSSTDLKDFIWANVAQNATILFSYLAYIRYKHGDESLIWELINFKEWPKQFMNGLKTIKLGLQPAFLTLMDIGRGILTNLFMRNSLELGAFQILQFFPNVFTGMAAIETRIAAQCIDSWDAHKKNPIVLKRELYEILFHSTWLASLPSLALIACSIFLKEMVLGFHRKPHSASDDIYQIMSRDLLLMSMIPLLRNIFYAWNGVVTGFKKMRDPVAELDDENTEILDPYYQAINRQAVGLVSIASIITFLIGVGLDYSNEAGAQNYWASMIGVMLVVLPIQLRNAIKSIQHTVKRAEANVNGTVRQQFSMPSQPVSQSWFSTFASTSRSTLSQFGNRCHDFFTSRFTYRPGQ